MDKTLTKGLAALEVLAKSEQAIGVTELAKTLGLTKSNVYRLLQTLQHLGFVQQPRGSSRYELTIKLWEISQHYAAHFDLQRIAHGHLVDLSERSGGETVHLSILDGAEVIFIDKVDGSHPIRSYSRIGGRAPAYTTATGKALLSAIDSNKVIEIIDDLHSYTQRTVKSFGQLERELARARADGFAINHGEWREGVCGVAASIHDCDGNVIAAVGISGPADRLSEDVLVSSGALVRAAASAISREMGFVQ